MKAYSLSYEYNHWIMIEQEVSGILNGWIGEFGTEWSIRGGICLSSENEKEITEEV